MKIKKILLVIIAILLFIFTMNSNCFANNTEENVTTMNLNIDGVISNGNETQYRCYINIDGKIKTLSINSKDYNLPSNLYDYNDDLLLRITYSQENDKIYDCKVINRKTDEIIEDVSEENINKLFNVEYGKKIIEKEWTDNIKLSELKKTEIYKYTANSETQFPKIENDIRKNCIVYLKQKSDDTYKENINIYKKVSSSATDLSFNQYDSGDTFFITYREVENEELLKLLPKDKIIYLSNYNDGDELEYKFKDYIYNNTEKNIKINIKNTSFGVEKFDSIIIEKDKIYEFDWMIDSANITYTDEIIDEEINNDAKNEETTKNDIDENNQTEQQNKDTGTTKINHQEKDNNINISQTINKDKNNNQQEQINKNASTDQTDHQEKDNNINPNINDTTISSTLPKTGTINLLIIIILNIIIMVIIGIKLRNFKDIE